MIPGSHKLGVIDPAAIGEVRGRMSETACVVARGGALLMRPLLLHASSPATVVGHRRAGRLHLH
jgi:hypothetical protein